jgi:hypothetical protein
MMQLQNRKASGEGCGTFAGNCAEIPSTGLTRAPPRGAGPRNRDRHFIRFCKHVRTDIE